MRTMPEPPIPLEKRDARRAFYAAVYLNVGCFLVAVALLRLGVPVFSEMFADLGVKVWGGTRFLLNWADAILGVWACIFVGAFLAYSKSRTASPLKWCLGFQISGVLTTLTLLFLPIFR